VMLYCLFACVMSTEGLMKTNFRKVPLPSCLPAFLPLSAEALQSIQLHVSMFLFG
jgi:hypothetical protein